MFDLLNQYPLFLISHALELVVEKVRLRKSVSTGSTERVIIIEKYMLFVGWEVCILKNCDRGIENVAQGRSPRSPFFTIWSDPKPVNILFIFSKLSNEKKNSRKNTHASVTVTVVRDRKIRTAVRTNQIVGFVTVLAWKKK